MPYRNVQTRQTLTVELQCNGCQNNISTQQAFFECDECQKRFHPFCKNIHGIHITRLAGNPTWFCNEECGKSFSLKLLKEKPQAIPSESGVNSSAFHGDGADVNDSNTQPQKMSSHPVIESVKQTVSSLSTQLTGLLATVHDLSSMLEQIQSSQNELVERVDVSEKQVGELQNKHQELEDKICGTSEAQLKQDVIISKLENKLESMEKKLIENHLIITGIPDKSQKPEDVIVKILGILQADVTLAQIQELKYIETNNQERSASKLKSSKIFLQVRLRDRATKEEILTRFRTRQQLFAKEVDYNVADNKRIFIREELTRFQAGIFRKALQFKSENNFKFLWVKNNNIYLKKESHSKVITIKQISDLDDIQSAQSHSQADSIDGQGQSTTTETQSAK